jgi:hypothetical protein
VTIAVYHWCEQLISNKYGSLTRICYEYEILVKIVTTGPAVSALQFATAKVKQRWLVIGWVTKNYYLELLRASEGTLSCWAQI